MLPKKRKFDLSKFDLETSSPGPSQNSNASEGRGSTETPSTPASIAPTPGLPSASLFQIRSGGSGDATISLPIFAAKGLPASGFLTPETVHEAFAGNFLRKSTPSSSSGLLGKPGISSPTVGVVCFQMQLSFAHISILVSPKHFRFSSKRAELAATFHVKQ